MRRRRRQSTQIIKKNNYSSASYPSYPQRPSSGFNWKRFFTWSFFIIVLGAVSYLAYNWNPSLPLQQDNSQISTEETDQPAVEEPEETPVESAPFQDNIQIEILNGCGFNGVAKIFQDYLRTQGYDVVNTDNYLEDGKIRWDVQNSMVIDRVGQIEQAMAVARTLSIPREYVISRENPNAIYDVSVVIGKDFKKLSGSN